MKEVNRITLYGILFLFLFCELTVFSKLGILGVKPDLLLIATLFFGFQFGIRGGIEVGIICGTSKDLLSVTTFGVNAFSFLFVGFLSGLLKDKVFKDNLIIQFMVSTAAVSLVAILHFLLLSNAEIDNVGAQLFKTALIKGLYTGFLAPIIFVILSAIFKPKEYEK